jgi:hypothetical protein
MQEKPAILAGWCMVFFMITGDYLSHHVQDNNRRRFRASEKVHWNSFEN